MFSWKNNSLVLPLDILLYIIGTAILLAFQQRKLHARSACISYDILISLRPLEKVGVENEVVNHFAATIPDANAQKTCNKL